MRPGWWLPNSASRALVPTRVAHVFAVIFGPTSIGTYAGDAGTLVDKKAGGYTANALGFMSPEDWYFTK